MQYFAENCNFYTDYAQFEKLINHYARRLKDTNARWDLWGFLWLLEAKQKHPERYICVALRNEYIRLSKLEARNVCEALTETNGTKDVLLFEIFDSFRLLTDTERRAITAKIQGFSADEAARLHGVTRQAEHKNRVRAMFKLDKCLNVQ